MLPPVGHVVGIQAFTPSNDYIAKSSVKKIETTDDLLCQELGVKDYSQGCKTCGAFLDECPGHYGHLVMPIPVFRIFFVERLLNILNSVCFFCQRLRLPVESQYYAMLKDLDPKQRLQHVQQYGFKYKRCGTKRTKDQSRDADTSTQFILDSGHNEGCGRLFIKFIAEDRSKMFVRAVVPLETSDYERHLADCNYEPCRITPQNLYDFLWSLPTSVKEALGCNEWNEPEALMWVNLPMPSHNTRPAHVYGKSALKRRTQNDWTYLLQQIVLARNRLQSSIRPGSVPDFSICVFSFNQIVAKDVATCFRYRNLAKDARNVVKRGLKEEARRLTVDGVEGHWRELNRIIAAFHSFRHKKVANKHTTYSGPKKGVEDRFRGQKDGRWRRNVIANRVNYALRGVLEGEIYMRPDQIGIPLTEAMKLSIKVMVCDINRAQAHAWVMRGPMHHPGANYVQLKSGEEINLLFCENRRDIDINDVLFVHRHIIENDLVIGNRQPTLHRGSAMSFKVSLIDEPVVRLHPSVFTPLAADCDGDELQVYVPQTIESRAEMAICAVDQCIMKDGRVVIKCILNCALGAYLLTRPETVWFDADDAFALATLLGPDRCFLLGPPDVSEKVRCKNPSENCKRGHWSGSQITSLLFPRDFTMRKGTVVIERGQLLSGQLTEDVLNGRRGDIEHLYRDYEDKSVTIDFLFWSYQLFQKYLDMHGMSAGYFDCTLDRWRHPTGDGCLSALIDEVDNRRKTLHQLTSYADRVQAGVLNPHHNSVDLETNVRRHVERYERMMLDAVTKYFRWTDRSLFANGVLHGIESGSKGSLHILNQMAGISGQVFVAHQRLEHHSSHFKPGVNALGAAGLVTRPLASGLNVEECIVISPGTCEGVLHKNRRTAISGYTVRRIVNGMMDVVVDRLGRVVDSTGRVLSETYGGDGYDSSTLTNERLNLLDLREPEVVSNYGVIFDKSRLPTTCGPAVGDAVVVSQDEGLVASMSAKARQRWRISKRDSATTEAFHEDIVTTVGIYQKLRRALFTREDQDTVNLKVRSPFSFEHLFNRCRTDTRVTRPVDITPLECLRFAQGLWDRLCRTRLVIATNLALKAVFVHWFHATRVICEWGFGLKQLVWLSREMIALLSRAVVDPGESVGTLATQCLGEPFTQTLLKSTHVAGKVSAVQDGLTRFTNLVNGDFRNVRTSLVIKKGVVRNETQASLLGLSLTRSLLSDVCVEYPSYKLEASWCRITVKLDRDMSVARGVSPRRIALRISEIMHVSLDLFEVSFATEDRWRIRIRVPFTSKIWVAVRVSLSRKQRSNEVLIAENLVFNLFKTIVIGGLPEIDTFIADEVSIVCAEGKETRWRLSLFGMSDRRKEKMKEKRKRLGPEQKTEETFARILRLPWVDPFRTTCSDANAVCKVLGLDAARKVLEQEFLNIMSGTTDRRHVDLLCRVMSKDMSIQGMKINQIGRCIPPLQRVAYEHGPDQMTEICSNREVDDCGTVCGANFANVRVKAGTGHSLEVLVAPSSRVPTDPSSRVPTDPSSRVPTDPSSRIPTDPSSRVPTDPSASALVIVPGFVRRPRPELAVLSSPRNPRTPVRVRDVVFSPKIDGLRVFLVFFKDTKGKEIASLVDRNFRVFGIQQSAAREWDPLREGTVLDGELVEIPGHTSVHAFVAFDCLMLCGNQSASLRYDQRLELAREAVFVLCKGSKESIAVDLGANASFCLPISLRPKVSRVLRRPVSFPFFVAVKPVFALEGIEYFARVCLPKYAFPTDGFVFTRLADEAQPFLMSARSILKWKPRLDNDPDWDQNTIDVIATSRPAGSPVHLPDGSPRLLHRYRSRDGPILMFGLAGKGSEPFLFSAGFFDMQEKIKDGAVYEARWNTKRLHWCLFRSRDKKANSMSTIERCLTNINENITLKDVVNACC